MRSIWAICRREFASFFVTPIGYVILGMYSAITGIMFAFSFLWYVRVSQRPTMFDFPGVPDFEETLLSPYLVFCGQVILFLGPLITMRLLAEEKSRGTMELLYTYPLRDRDIIFGKYLASLGMAFLMMLVVGIQLTLLLFFTRVEPAVLAFGMLTVFLMAAAFFSLGLFVSSLCRNQITAASATFGLFFLSFALGAAGKDLPDELVTPDWMTGFLETPVKFGYSIFRRLVLELPLDAHAKEMAQGIVSPEDIAYYILFAAFFLFLTFRVLEARKWRTTA